MSAPLPKLAGATATYYGYLADGELRFQRCAQCRAWAFPPRYRCPACGADALAWEPASPRGSVYSWTLTERPLHPAFTELPLAIGLVQLDDGPRLMARLTGASVPVIGMRVEHELTRVAEGVVLPCFRPASEKEEL